MGSSSTDDRLARAHQLIEANELEESAAILEPIIAEEPENADAWWLYAHSVADSNKAREALDNILRIDPNYPGAVDLYRLLDEQMAQETSPIAPAPAGKISPIKPITPPPALPEAELAELEEPFEFEDFEDTSRPVPSRPIEFERGKEKPKRRLPIPIIAIVVIVAVVLLAALLVSGVLNPPPPRASTPTVVAQAAVETETEQAAVAEIVETEPIETVQVVEIPTEEVVETESVTATDTQMPTAAPTRTPTETETEETAMLTQEVEETGVTVVAMAMGSEESISTKATATVKPTQMMTATSEPTRTPTSEPPTATPTIRPTATTPPLTDTKAPTATETEAQAVAMIATEALAAATEATISAPAETAVPTEQTSEATAETGVPSVNFDAFYTALSDYQVLNNGILLSHTALGNTLVVTVCSTAGLETRTNLVPIMNTIARQAVGLDSSIEAVAAHLVNCTTGRSILIIAVDTTSAVEYAAGNLTDREFQLAWKPQ